MKQKIKLSIIDINKGQIDGVKANPRLIKDYKFDKLVKSIEETPELLEHRGILVFPHNNR